MSIQRLLDVETRKVNKNKKESNKYEKVYEDCDNCFEQSGTYLSDFKRQCNMLLVIPSAGIPKGSREI